MRLRRAILVAAVMTATALPAPRAHAQLDVTVAPDIPALGAVTLTAARQDRHAQMPAWEVRDTRAAQLGWHVTAQGDGSAGRSAVFSEYCTDGTVTNGCSTAVAGGPGPGYVTGGAALAAASLRLDSTGASFTPQGTTQNLLPPQHVCSAGCALDTTAGVSVASAAVGAALGTWRAEGYSATSLSLALPTTVRFIGAANKVYRLDLLWTLVSGP